MSTLVAGDVDIVDIVDKKTGRHFVQIEVGLKRWRAGSRTNAKVHRDAGGDVRKKPKLTIIQDDGSAILPPVKPRPRILRPKTARGALSEASRLYVQARRGEIAAEEATKLVYILRTCSTLHEEAEVAPRLEALEARIEALLGRRGS
jgi:hypothetical protein